MTDAELADWLRAVTAPDAAGEASPAGSPGTPASRPVSPALENELLKKLKAERAAGRLNQWRHAATKVARRALATERDEARVEVARLTAEVRAGQKICPRASTRALRRRAERHCCWQL